MLRSVIGFGKSVINTTVKSDTRVTIGGDIPRGKISQECRSLLTERECRRR